MKITKLGHSCVLVEVPDRIAIFDPGVWSTGFNIDQIDHVDRIVITHGHQDHFDLDMIKALVDKFPQAHIICGTDIADQIIEANIKVILREESDCVVKFKAPHERVPVPGVPETPENGYHFKGLFTHAGDSHSIDESKKVLAIAFVAPWGSATGAVDKILDLKPEYVLPIHDWQYTDEAREWLEGLLNRALEGTNTKLLSSDTGITHEIS